jgi:hypothetical protein
VAIVGNVERAQAEAIAAAVVKQLPGGQAAPALPPVPALDTACTVRQAFPSSQTHLLIGQPGMSREDPLYFPLYGGIVDDESGQLSLTVGGAYKTSDCIVEALEAWWAAWDTTEQVARARRQITRDYGPESRGKRTQFLQRMVRLCEAMGQPIQRRYSPPYPSKYHPIERWWGILALPWPGTKVVTVETVVEWTMRAVEARLERPPELPYWDMLIRPASTS